MSAGSFFNAIIITSSSSSRVLSCLLVWIIISALKIAKWKCRKTFIMFCSSEGQEERRAVFCGIGHLQGWGDVTFDNIDGFYWWLWYYENLPRWAMSGFGATAGSSIRWQEKTKPGVTAIIAIINIMTIAIIIIKIIAQIILMIIATLQAVLSSNKHRRSKGWVAGREQCDHQSLTTEVPFHHPALYLAVCMIIPV